jgi:hypothetical protein
MTISLQRSLPAAKFRRKRSPRIARDMQAPLTPSQNRTMRSQAPDQLRLPLLSSDRLHRALIPEQEIFARSLALSHNPPATPDKTIDPRAPASF